MSHASPAYVYSKHVCQFGYTYSIAYGGKCEIHPILLCHPHIACGHFRHFTSKGVFLIYWLYHYISPGIVFINDASWSTWCYFIICIYCILLYILCFIPWTGQELTSIKMIYILTSDWIQNKAFTIRLINWNIIAPKCISSRHCLCEHDINANYLELPIMVVIKYCDS